MMENHGSSESNGVCKQLFRFADRGGSQFAFHALGPTPFSSASGPATGSFNGLHPKSKFLAVVFLEQRTDFAVTEHRRIEIHVHDGMCRVGGHAEYAVVIG
jgi:hypothetical protein